MTSLSSSQKLVPGIELMVSLNLKRQIVKAIGLAKGHWFKCPNGHYYCIGECGDAMQEVKCPECGAKIGAWTTSHFTSCHQITSWLQRWMELSVQHGHMAHFDSLQ